MVLIIQISNGNNLDWNKIQFQDVPKETTLWHDPQHMSLSKICKKEVHIISICCRTYNHHLQRIHAHCHWETCGFGIHMGPHNQCRALLVWTQHVTLNEQKSIITHCKRNRSPSPHLTYMKLTNFYIFIFQNAVD